MPVKENNPTPVERIIGWMIFSGGVAVVLDLFMVKPQWLAHFVASSFGCCFGTAVLFFYGLHPRSNFIGRKTKLARQSENVQRNAQRVIRFLVIGFAGCLLFFVDLPIVSDWTHFIQKGQSCFSQIEARVDKNSMFFGTFFMNQTLYLTTKNGQTYRSCFAVFFPKVARYHNVYWFLIAPRSGFILDWQLANDSTNPPTWK